MELAPYAANAGNTLGRRYPEPEHPYRGPFQRDRDRIIHSSAFRRLEKKTQVFVVFEGDYYRTRLTHTIEVAQISRSIARALRVNEDLAEAIALAHDLGHPPFGHAGEQALHSLMEGHGGFEHNMQSLRIVDLLETRYPDFPGLNLTLEVREGIVKHQTRFDKPDMANWDGPAGMPTVEAQIVNLADQITYSCHDLDDGLKSGIISESEIRRVEICAEAIARMNRSGNDASEKMRRYQLIRHIIDAQVTDLLETTHERLAASGAACAQDVRSQPEYLVAASETMRCKTQDLTEFLYENFYRNHRVMRMSYKAERVLSELFRAYSGEKDLLPGDSRAMLCSEPKERVVCDYIAGMTDNYALNEHSRLFGIIEFRQP